MISNEPTMIGLSEQAHSLLSQMKEDKHLAEMADGYRLGIAFALSQGIDPPDVPAPRTTVFSVATVDPDQELAVAIRALMDLEGTSVYRMAERLADWGIREIAERASGGPISMAHVLPMFVGRTQST